jgi:hypothetical protein
MSHYLKYRVGSGLFTSILYISGEILSRGDPDKIYYQNTLRKIKTKDYLFYVNTEDYNRFFMYRKRNLFDTWRGVVYSDFGGSHAFDVIFDPSQNEKLVGKMLEKCLYLKAFW